MRNIRNILKLIFTLTMMVLSFPASTAGIYRYAPLTYSDSGNNWITDRATPEAACDDWASLWSWNTFPYSYALEAQSAGLWKCQRYNAGAIEANNYTWIIGRCQKSPSSILTGSDWNYPGYDVNMAPSCYCNDPQIFDRGVEWCTANPSCLWYPDNKAAGCGKVVDSLISSSVSKRDPTSIFHNTQTCIAKESCNMRCKMGNCKWLNEVIPNFVNPYLQKQGKWPNIVASCRNSARNWFNDRVCAEAMARNHIFNDLLPALVHSGCGSETDWSNVFQTITQCTKQTFESTIEKTLASAPVYVYRQAVRSTCVAQRLAAGLDQEINLDLKGKSCAP